MKKTYVILKLNRTLYGLQNKNYLERLTMSDRVSRGHSLKLYKNQAVPDVKKFSFSYRVVNEWNRLPAAIVESNTVNAFKASYDR